MPLVSQLGFNARKNHAIHFDGKKKHVLRIKYTSKDRFMDVGSNVFQHAFNQQSSLLSGFGFWPCHGFSQHYSPH